MLSAMRAFLSVGLLAACATAPSAAHPITRAEAEAVLREQAAQWNRGDLGAFVETYWDGDELTFLGSGGLTRGRKDLLANYERSYPTAKARGELRFEILDFFPLGTDHALLLGSYDLLRARPDHGWFSLVLARRNGRIAILHDHTSAAR
ncbi:MAG: nuclear transport factor 2 family protein [Planctomycetota bacterium]